MGPAKTLTNTQRAWHPSAETITHLKTRGNIPNKCIWLTSLQDRTDKFNLYEARDTKILERFGFHRSSRLFKPKELNTEKVMNCIL